MRRRVFYFFFSNFKNVEKTEGWKFLQKNDPYLELEILQFFDETESVKNFQHLYTGPVKGSVTLNIYSLHAEYLGPLPMWVFNNVTEDFASPFCFVKCASFKETAENEMHLVPELHLPLHIHMHILIVFGHYLETNLHLQHCYSLLRQGNYQLNALTPESKYTYLFL
ncbi:uncharacterized protein [Henckelia pumila]|uniref:uncharacterized protein n=1 Tax=Henckelia pumila TaxID=405737 RepID=UPI003C6E0099